MFYVLNDRNPDREKYSLPRMRLVGPADPDDISALVNIFIAKQGVHPLAVSCAHPVSEPHGDYTFVVTRMVVTVIYQDRIGLPVPIAEDPENEWSD